MQNLLDKIIKSQTYITRKDFADWKSAQQYAQSIYNPKQYLLQRLYKDVMQDALMTSQIEGLRISKTKGADFDIIARDGKTDELSTQIIKDSGLYESIAEMVIESLFYGYTVIELSKDRTGGVRAVSIPRENIEPTQGLFLPDSTSDGGAIHYRNIREFGKTILEVIPKPDDLGFINKAVPYVLIKKFAFSCWSEFCEIFGMPPRVLKTNTQDKSMLDRAEVMMREIGSAAYFIIDTNEELDFGQGVTSNGDVYSNLITKCDSQISLINLAAVIGQDTQNGNYSKEESSAKLTDAVIAADKRLVEQTFNRQVLPALAALGLVKDGLRLQISKSKDIEALWSKTVQAMPYYEVDPAWIKDTFGIEVTAKKAGQLSAIDGFFA